MDYEKEIKKLNREIIIMILGLIWFIVVFISFVVSFIFFVIEKSDYWGIMSILVFLYMQWEGKSIIDKAKEKKREE
jgi:hypothetical protein